ncbi:hypothetical protein ABZV75_19885 [Streptomyces flaveolus]
MDRRGRRVRPGGNHTVLLARAVTTEVGAGSPCPLACHQRSFGTHPPLPV